MLKGTACAPAPIAIYLSSDGEFLSRANRARNVWYHHHYLNGVRPALFERFKGRIEWLDDADVLAGRLKQYRMVLCPIFQATTDQLLAKLREYQAAGGTIVGDDLWQVSGLIPNDTFPGRDVDAYQVPYANEHLRRWHQANRTAILAWQPRGLPPDTELFAIDTASADAIPALREVGGVRYAVVANCRFRRGEFAERHRFVNEDYLDQGVAQETDLTVAAPAQSAVYDVVSSRRLDPEEYAVLGDRVRLRVKLPPAGGALYAFHPQLVAAVVADPGTTAPVAPGTLVNLAVTVRGADGAPVPGHTVVALNVIDAQGQVQEVSGHHVVRGGAAGIPFGIPLGAAPGAWSVAVTDLTSGLTSQAGLTVAALPGQAGD